MNHQFEIAGIDADWALIKQGKIWEFFFWLFSVHCFYLDVLGKRHHLKQLEKSLQNIIKNQKVITKNLRVTERLIWKIATSEGQDWNWEDYEWLGRGLSGLTNKGETYSCGESKAGSKLTRSHLLVILSAESKVNSDEFTQSDGS